MVTMNDDRAFQFFALAALSFLILIVAIVSDAGWIAAFYGIAGCCVAAFLLHFLRPVSVPAPTPVIADKNEKNLFENNSFSSILNGLNDPMLVIDRGKVLLANSAATGLLGAHIIGEDARIAIRHPAATQLLSGVTRTSGPEKIDIMGLGSQERQWTMHMIPINDQGRQPSVLVHLVDQSARQALDRARVDFVANASHELRTPLSTIIGYIETLMDPDAGSDAKLRQRFLTIVDSEARRMQALIDDLMSLSRIESDRYRLPKDTLDLADLTAQVSHEARHILGDRGADIINNIGDGQYLIRGDRAQISQLLHNLIENAAKYGRAGTPITVSLLNTPSKNIRLEVRDVGEGISEDHLPRLTERFFRVDSSRSRSVGGTGLGLAIVKHIAERHRGRLTISSIEGKGTRVSIQFPMQNTTGPSDAPARISS